jgi:mannose-6-phosphate isomerase
MAIALTPFLAFLNFLPCQTILLHLLTVPEIRSLVPTEHINQLAQLLTLPTTLPPDQFLFEPTKAAPSEEVKQVLKKIFAAIMGTKEDEYKSAVKALVERYEKGEEVVESEKGLVELALMLNEQYPGDIGVLCVFLLNVVELKEGEAAFLGANMPHAYIKGGMSFFLASAASKLNDRYHRMYGDIRQCRPSRSHP